MDIYQILILLGFILAVVIMFAVVGYYRRKLHQEKNKPVYNGPILPKKYGDRYPKRSDMLVNADKMDKRPDVDPDERLMRVQEEREKVQETIDETRESDVNRQSPS